MSRFHGSHPGTRQDRGHRRAKPATREERLASMRRNLEWRERVYGTQHPLTEMQRETIRREKEK